MYLMEPNMPELPPPNLSCFIPFFFLTKINPSLSDQSLVKPQKFDAT